MLIFLFFLTLDAYIKWLRRWKNSFCNREDEREVRNNAILKTIKIIILSISQARKSI